MAKAKVLLVDDNEDMLSLLSLLIQSSFDADTFSVSTEKEVKALSEHFQNFKIAFIDINLGPGQPDGIDIYDWLRANSFDGPIYFLSDLPTNSPMTKRALKRGDTKILSKPINPDKITSIIREILKS